MKLYRLLRSRKSEFSFLLWHSNKLNKYTDVQIEFEVWTK